MVKYWQNLAFVYNNGANVVYIWMTKMLMQTD